MGLCHTTAILSRETKVILFYLPSLAPKIFTARSGVVKQSYFQSLGTIKRVSNAHGQMLCLIDRNTSRDFILLLYCIIKG